MDLDSPLLSLAIPIRNADDSPALKTTLDSISQLRTKHTFEVCIQVGQDIRTSFDTALLNHPSNPVWCFEKDIGIYSAMNILSTVANGSRILFLGAGDCLLPGIAKAIHRWSKNHVLTRLELGGVCLPRAEARVPVHYPARWDSSLLWRNTTHHQGIAYPRQMLINFGGFSEKHQVLADYALNLKMWQQGIPANWKNGENWISAAAGGVSRQFTTALYAEELSIKRQELRPGITRWVQPVWIRLKYLWKQTG